MSRFDLAQFDGRDPAKLPEPPLGALPATLQAEPKSAHEGHGRNPTNGYGLPSGGAPGVRERGGDPRDKPEPAHDTGGLDAGGGQVGRMPRQGSEGRPPPVAWVGRATSCRTTSEHTGPQACAAAPHRTGPSSPPRRLAPPPTQRCRPTTPVAPRPATGRSICGSRTASAPVWRSFSARTSMTPTPIPAGAKSVPERRGADPVVVLPAAVA
jgi:hypothetical protein